MSYSRFALLLPLGLLLPLSQVVAAVDTCGAQQPSQQTSLALDLSRHMPLQRIHSGMAGYGVTAMPGNPETKFEVEIVDVLHDFAGPGRHVILANCSGADLEKTGILAGMSGSPVYVQDPEDGNKYKMIGAVAYGWSFNKEPLCGIQPIEQMLTARTNSSGASLCAADTSGNVAGMSSGGISATSSDILRKLSTGWRGNAANIDPLFDSTGTPSDTPGSAIAATRLVQASTTNDNNLQPLSLPLAVAGGSESLMGHLQNLFSQSGLMPVSTASASGSRMEDGAALRHTTLKTGRPGGRPAGLGRHGCLRRRHRHRGAR